ncbi:hypothetical protein Sme01_35460 [Sphaerisporangium melleum]|uniref:Uncharacterized protein n=1 Tax=Sphaerisporangium melleum TaxID=321316 RepID=A0A917VMU0_9ACTN|nr:hypothetical protein [Sphaerisporangium melleum]GGK97097.1 hypothetical protein GCM10007964_44120 [Sphaerisporangium melleum]GII71070.1 hypothetical protein Sme01_35460 [Sphaerisporangium melleum]
MAAGSDEADLREELRTVEEDLAKLRETLADLRGSVGDRSEGPTDAVETSMLINMADEQEQLITTLEARRDDLRRRVGEA